MEMDEFIRWPKPYLLLSATCDEMLSWMVENWIKSHVVRDSNCNTVNPFSPQKLQGMTTNLGLTFSVGDTIPWFTISIEQDNQKW